eukprot:14764213-Alexandrium_andersonii.AAC.1
MTARVLRARITRGMSALGTNWLTRMVVLVTRRRTTSSSVGICFWMMIQTSKLSLQLGVPTSMTPGRINA